MSRKLTFDAYEGESGASQILFLNLYNGFIGRSDSPNRARTIEETRTAIKILDALDEVSEIKDLGTHTTRFLKKEGGTVVLADEEYKLLQAAVESYVATLPFALARPGMVLKKFIDDAAKE